jgi:hypothetical protein
VDAGDPGGGTALCGGRLCGGPGRGVGGSLSALKDECLSGSAEKIVTIVEDEDAVAVLTNERIMPILMGQESVMTVAVETDWIGTEAVEIPIDIRKAA